MGMAVIRIPIGQIVAIAIRIIKKAAFLDDEAAGVDTASAAEPADRPFADGASDGVNALRYMGALGSVTDIRETFIGFQKPLYARQAAM